MKYLASVWACSPKSDAVFCCCI